MAKMKIAIIGCGTIANSAHIPAYMKNEEVEIKYFCDILLHKAEEMLLAESPVAPLFYEKSNYVASKDLSKYEVTYRGTMDFRNMKLKGYKKVNEAKVAAEEAEEVAK
jgi:ABC-type oligopeptide transport system substrate-binding subunit